MWNLCNGNIENAGGRTSFDAMRAGDKAGTEVVDEYTSYLACAIANFINIFQPEVFLIGGGISNERDYLMKPVSRDKLFGVLNRALEKRKREERCLNLELGGEMVRIPFYDIRYLDVRQNYVTIHGKTEYTVKRSLNEFEKELDDRFFRAGRSLIINLKYIRRVTKTEVSLSDGTLLPLPRGAYEPLNRAIIKHT